MDVSFNFVVQLLGFGVTETLVAVDVEDVGRGVFVHELVFADHFLHYAWDVHAVGLLGL